MKVIIEGEGKEIAALVLAVQERQDRQVSLKPERIRKLKCLSLAKRYQIPLFVLGPGGGLYLDCTIQAEEKQGAGQRVRGGA